MQKAISLLLALLFVLSLAACGGPSKKDLQREADMRTLQETQKRIQEMREEDAIMKEDFQKFYDAYDNYKKYN